MRLIDADKLPKYTGYALSAAEVAMAVESAPTVDPVKQGRWIKDEWISRQTNERRSGITCSRCNVSFFQRYEDSENFMPNYCPNCGARMDEVGE